MNYHELVGENSALRSRVLTAENKSLYLEREIETLQARVEELEAAQAPRPIKDAPRDGTMIFAYRKSIGEWVTAYMDGSLWNTNPYGGEWLSDDAFRGWIPLPPAPTEDAE